MSQQNQGNKQSEKGEARHPDRHEAKTIKSEEHVGSSSKEGIRFPLANHHGMGEVDKGPSTP